MSETLARNAFDVLEEDDRVRVAFFRERRLPDALEGVIVATRPALDEDRDTSRILVETEVGARFCVDFGGGVSRVRDGEPDRTIGYAAAITREGSR